MNIYKKKRQKINMSAVDMANNLGLDYRKYRLIEQGLMKMPKELIDKFNNITNDGAINKINELEHQKIVTDWYSENFLNDEKFKEILSTYNIRNQKHLSQLLGYNSASIIPYMKNKGESANYNFKNRLYTFLTNEMNIQIPDKYNKTTKKENVEQNELYLWYKNFDMEEFLSNMNLNLHQLQKLSGISHGTLLNIAQHVTASPHISTLKKLKDFVDKQDIMSNVEQKHIDIDLMYEFPEIPSSEEALNIESLDIFPNMLIKKSTELDKTEKSHTIADSINKYRNMIKNENEQMQKLKEQITELERSILINTEVLKELEIIEHE